MFIKYEKKRYNAAASKLCTTIKVKILKTIKVKILKTIKNNPPI
jgi:hypothetical protein